MEKMKMVLVSGVAGAGKTTFASVCEEKGYHVIEELPTSMIPSLLDVFKAKPEEYAKNALFVNIVKIADAAELLRADPAFDTTVVGLDCSRDVLLTRFRLTRHIHPLQPKGYTLEEALGLDEKAMKETQPILDVYIDTTGLTEKDLRKKAAAILGDQQSRLNVIFSSFGYKYGLPRDAEIVIDARVLKNPYWVKELSRLTGLDKPVVDYIRADPKTPMVLQKLYDILDPYFESAVEEGRNFVTIDIGCSGGQHRSVFVAEELFAHYKNRYACTVYHREINRYVEDEKD
jgi:RNase adapter protein RapZ